VFFPLIIGPVAAYIFPTHLLPYLIGHANSQRGLFLLKTMLLTIDRWLMRLTVPVLGAMTLWLTATLDAQTVSSEIPDAPVAHGMPTDRPPVIDGQPNEEAWQRAPVISGFVQHEPFEGQQPSERTEVRILFDSEAVYIAGWMLDRDPENIVLGETRRDASLRETDAFLIVLDTYRDRQNGFVFGTTPAGIEYDGQVTKEGAGGISSFSRQQAGSGGGFNLNWDGSWEVATTVDESGWYAEFRIPFSTLRYGTGGSQVWGMNISRTIRRHNEEVFWAPISRQYTLYRVSEAGTLEGIEAPTRRTMLVTPYALSSAHKDYVAATDADVDAEIGGDAKIGLSPSLTLDLTYNTDFAQVEVDERQINLTRFPLFFPEKRPFFLENAGTFSVGIPRSGSDLGIDLFFSRQIGIGEEGTPVPILGGGKLTGKAGGLTLGVMTIQTEAVEEQAISANNYSVGRVIRELPNRSRVGAMVVSRLNTDATEDYNLTYSADGRLGIGESMNIDAYFARSETPDLDGREHALGVTWGYATRDWDLGAQYREVGEDFNAEVGFVPRTNHRMYIGRLQRNIRPAGVSFIRELRPHILFRNWFDFDGFNVTRYLHVDWAVNLSDGSSSSTAVNFSREGLKEPFEIAEGIVIPAATYDFAEFKQRFNTNQSAPLSVTGEIILGGFFSGHRKSFVGSINGRSGATLAASIRLGYDDVDLAEGSFETALAGLRVAYSFTPRIFLESLIQYTNQDDDLSGNIRFGWLDTAGTGLFLVYNEVRQTVSPTGPQDRAFIVKFTRQLNLLR
jgi:hypothetical protein